MGKHMYILGTCSKNVKTALGEYHALKEAKAALNPKEKKLFLIGIPEGSGMWMYFEKEEFDSNIDEILFYIEEN
jgi:hypothetical protein